MKFHHYKESFTKLLGFSHGERTRTNKTPYKIPLTIMNESRMQSEGGDHSDDHDQGRNKRKLEQGLINADDVQVFINSIYVKGSDNRILELWINNC